MFGYVKTDMPYMYVKDTVLYKAMYCGLCKGIGKTCGHKARMVLNYDLTFLSVFLHNIMNIDVKVNKEHCIIHHIRKRPVANVDPLTDRIACLNVILAYHKLDDDVIDNNKGRAKRSFFKSSYKKAKKQEPELDEIVKKRYNELLEYENKKSDSIDMVADPFGNMMADIVEVIAGKEYFNEDVRELSYNLGKWIYLIDALDDFDKDKKKNNFNVFINMYKDIETKNQLVQEKNKDLILVFGIILSTIQQLAKKMKYNFNHDLLDNVLLSGLGSETKKIMENDLSCKNTTGY